MMQLIVLVKPLCGYMTLAVMMGLIGHLCATFITVFGVYALLDLAGLSTPFPLRVIFICMVVFAFLRGILRYLEQACNHFIAFKLLALIRDRVFAALRRLAPAKLEGHAKGDLIAIITSDIELLEVFYAHTISPVFIACLFIVLLCLYIGSFHMYLGLLALAAYLCVGIFIPLIISKMSKEDGMHFRKQSGELSGFILDGLRGLSEILQFSHGQMRLQEMENRVDALSIEEAHMKQVVGRNLALTNTVILLFDIGMLFCAGWLYGEGVISFQAVILSCVALMSSFGPCVALANLGSTLQNTLAAGNRVLDLLEEKPLVEKKMGYPKTRFQHAAFDHVTFAYEKDTVIDDVSLDIPCNTIIGISGKSGSGKSTMLKLLMRFWETQKGELRISDRNINAINTRDLRSMESYMTQETYLFHDTLLNNLRIAKADATMEEVICACQKASVHDFITQLPDGYDTQVGELGATLSGGEKQRLGLARAFLHNADVLLLDEPTSNLDSLNEAIILKSLQEEREDKTVILVSHRISTMHIADQVYHMKKGRMS